MPSKSKKQHAFFEAIAHSPEFAKKAGVSQSVGEDFVNADKSTGKYQPKRKSKAAEAFYGKDKA